MKDRVNDILEQKRNVFSNINDQIWAHPELSFKEYFAADLLTKYLEEQGFQVERGVAGIPTAFKAVYGTGKPAVGYLAEYDALANLSQKACVAEKHPIEEGGNGHGCGHNSIGTACVAAAVAMKEIMAQDNLPGTVIVFGCPAEEDGGGKCFMARAGVFSDVDMAFAPHPGDANSVMGVPTLANVQVAYSFSGVSAHAAGMPERGRSALDAADLMIMGVQFLREHVIQEARIHHAYLDAGGISPNVVQSTAKLLFYIRAPKAEQVLPIFERVNKVAHGAAMMTETTVEIDHRGGLADVVPNDVLGAVVAESWAEVGPTQYSEESKAFAAQMAKSLGTDQKKYLDDSVPGYKPSNYVLPGSSDVGDVSYYVPVVIIGYAGTVAGSAAHSWQFVAQSGSPITHDALLHAAKVMANAGIKILKDPSITEKAKAELQAKTGGKIVSLVPAEAKPAI